MTALAIDFAQFPELRHAALNNDPAALREVAGQFEALFIQSMLKSMREASLGDPLLGDSNSHEMYEGMLDQQLAVEMASGKGIGLAEMLVRQLGGEDGAKVKDGQKLPDQRGFPLERTLPNERAYPINRASPNGRAYPIDGGPSNGREFALERTRRTAAGLSEPGWNDPQSFARDVWPHAKRVAKKLNVAPVGVLAQVALETGWGRHVMARGDGQLSFNLFGIKAGHSWSGDSVARRTVEFDGGVARSEIAQFRTYDNVAATFDDYAELMAENPRYSNVQGHGSDVNKFASALQSSGYATDPDYASKISRVANSDTMARVLAGLKNSVSSSINR